MQTKKSIIRIVRIHQVEYAKFIGPKVLKFFEKTFKVKYPLPKMDMIAIPDFSAGAMENWGNYICNCCAHSHSTCHEYDF